MSAECPECGSELHDSEFGLSRIFECGTAESVVYGLRQSEACRIRQLENLLRGWLTAFERYGPSGSHQFEKFDTIKRKTEMALDTTTEGKADE